MEQRKDNKTTILRVQRTGRFLGGAFNECWLKFRAEIIKVLFMYVSYEKCTVLSKVTYTRIILYMTHYAFRNFLVQRK